MIRKNSKDPGPHIDKTARKMIKELRREYKRQTLIRIIKKIRRCTIERT